MWAWSLMKMCKVLLYFCHLVPPPFMQKKSGHKNSLLWPNFIFTMIFFPEERYILHGNGTDCELITEVMVLLQGMDELQLRQCLAMIKAMKSVSIEFSIIVSCHWAVTKHIIDDYSIRYCLITHIFDHLDYIRFCSAGVLW